MTDIGVLGILTAIFGPVALWICVVLYYCPRDPRGPIVDIAMFRVEPKDDKGNRPLVQCRHCDTVYDAAVLNRGVKDSRSSCCNEPIAKLERIS